MIILNGKVDANQANQTGVYVCNPESLNVPGQNWALLYVQYSAGYIRQTWHSTTGNMIIYSRFYHNDTWDAWHRLDNFGCRTLAELKAALANV